MDRWVFKGRVLLLDIEGAKVKCVLDLGFGIEEERWLHLHGVAAPLPPHRARAASEWLKANEGRPVAVEVSKVGDKYCGIVQALTSPMRGFALNTQVELASSLVV